MKNNIAIQLDKFKIVFNYKTKNEQILLDEMNYSFEKNKIHFIIGNSGTGKTTLVTHFNGLLKSRYGDINILDKHFILGKNKKIKKIKELRKDVGLVFQFPEYQLFKDTIQADIMFGPINLGVSKEEAKRRAKKYLNMLGLDDSFLDRSPFNLSGGQKRRVALAGILAIEPKIIIFDEPTAGLDPTGEKEILNIILDLKNKGHTVFVISHMMNHVLEIADNVIVLGNKKVVAFDEPYKIFRNKKLIKENSLDQPFIIKIIEKLISKDKTYEKLYELKPRTQEQLAQYIYQIYSERGKE